MTGTWLPPVAGGVCFLTARAVNGDGVAATATAAVLVHPGTAPTVGPPQGSGLLPEWLHVQRLGDAGALWSCPAGEYALPVRKRVLAGWPPGLGDHHRQLFRTATDPDDASSFSALWTVPTVFGSCTTTVCVTNLEGVTTELAGVYSIGF